MVFDSGIGVKEVVFVVRIEERFIAPKPRDGAEYLSARADAFAGSEREEKPSARSARNDRLGLWSNNTTGSIRSGGDDTPFRYEGGHGVPCPYDNASTAGWAGVRCFLRGGAYNRGTLCPSLWGQNLGRMKSSRRLARVEWARCIGRAIHGWGARWRSRFCRSRSRQTLSD